MDKKMLNRQISGLYLLFIGISILLKVFFPAIKIVYFLLVFILIISIHMMVQIYKSKKRKKWIVFVSTLFGTSLFVFLYQILLVNYFEFEDLWPILGLFPSIGLIIYYISSHGKSVGAIIPGIFIAILSIVLLLIRNNIIHLDFINFLILLIAGMIILAGLYLMFSSKIKQFKDQIDKKFPNK